LPTSSTKRSASSSPTFEAAKHYTLTEHSMAPEALVFSKWIWNRLPAADQALVRQAAKDSVPHMRKLCDEREAKHAKSLRRAAPRLFSSRINRLAPMP
jgi:TRAP-type C4-dicarboxylate transport system substrate-binding protein